MFNWRVVLAAIFFIFVIWTIATVNVGNSNAAIDYVRGISHGDKIAHFFLFGLLSGCLIMAFGGRTVKLGPFHVYWGALLVGLFVLAEETSQAWIETRQFDVLDLAADFLGIALFSLLCFCLLRVFFKAA